MHFGEPLDGLLAALAAAESLERRKLQARRPMMSQRVAQGDMLSRTKSMCSLAVSWSQSTSCCGATPMLRRIESICDTRLLAFGHVLGRTSDDIATMPVAKEEGVARGDGQQAGEQIDQRALACPTRDAMSVDDGTTGRRTGAVVAEQGEQSVLLSAKKSRDK